MKILVLTNLYPPHYLGGYELICFHVVNALRARGRSIHVLTSNHTVDGALTAGGSRKDPIDHSHSVERSLKIHGFYGHPWLGIRQLRFLEFHNNTILRAAIETHRPDLVYVWNMGGLSKSMLFTLQQLEIPTVFYVSDHWIARGLTSDVWLRWWNRPDAPPVHRLGRQLLARVGCKQRWHHLAPANPCTQLQFRRISFCSRALRELTAAAGFDVGHAAVIHAPVNTARFSAEPKPIEQPMLDLLYVGRLAPDKGIMTALRAMADAQQNFPGTLTIFGRGDSDYVAELKRFAEEHQLRVRFASATLDEMPSVYPRYDALIFPSEWPEPFALTPLEAMACGLPVIATTTGGSAELFRHGENSLTFTAGDANELTNRILQLHHDPSLRTRIATAGYCEVRTRYAEPITVDQIEAYLTETLDQLSGVSQAPNLRVRLGSTPHLDSKNRVPRFTIDGSDSLESSLAELCTKTRDAILEHIPRSRIEALLLGGGYGRGEGGVLRTSDGDRPYNDLEFYLFLTGPQLLNQRTYGPVLHKLAQQLTQEADLDIEITPVSRMTLERSTPSMFYYDLLIGHRCIIGDNSVLSQSAHHRIAADIPLAEATRLLMNRASGLLFARERLLRSSFTPDDADFVGRNIAKAQLALGDVALTVFGRYHWSCRTRHERLHQLRTEVPRMPEIIHAHAAGVEFKLHPTRATASRSELHTVHETVSALARDLWLWLEQLRLHARFHSALDYALWKGNKCPETHWWRNVLVQAAAFGPLKCLASMKLRYPRERLLNSLPLLLWEHPLIGEPKILRVLQKNLRTDGRDFEQLTTAYHHLWTRFN